MSNEPEWKDANPQTENLPNKGRHIILFIAGGLALGILAIVGARIRPLGLIVGSFTFLAGLRMLIQKRQFFYKPGLIVTISGFFLLLSNPRFGIVAGFASTLLVIGALGLVVFGLVKAIKLAWDLGKFS